MAEATPTTSLSVVCGGGFPLLPSPSPSLPLTHLQLRNQFIAPPRGPSVGKALLSNGHMISALAFARDVYMNVSIPLNVDVTCQPSFLPWGRLALLLFILNGKSKSNNEGKGEMKIEEEDMKQSGLNGGQEDRNSHTLTPQVICTCFYGNEDDEDDDAASWNDLHGFCLKCECFYGVRAKYECNLNNLNNEEDSEDEFDDDNHKQEDDDDGNEDDEDFIVQFTCVSSSLSPNPTPHSGTNLLNPHSGTTFLLLPPRPPPHLQHVSSFSSDESGFCERLPFDWSNNSSSNDEEEEDEDDEEGDCTPCVFDEGLWHEFEEQACFNNNINSLFCPLSSSSSSSDSGSEVTIMEEIDPLPPSLHHLGESQTKDDSPPLPPLPPQHCQLSSCCKRVSFKPEPHLASVHYMVTWRYAYRMARKGHWEQLGLDRDRFQKRIETVDKAIGPCLLKKLEKMKQETAAAPLQ